MIKYIKLFLFTFLFALFGFGFTHGSTIQEVGLTPKNSEYDQNLEITFLKGGGVKTSMLGYGKGVLALKSDVLFWWTPNGLPYMYYKGGHWSAQGFFRSYSVCNPITGLSSGIPASCTDYVIDSGGMWREIFKTFYSTIDNGNWAGYYIGSSSDNQGRWGDYFKICFSNDEHSMCFFDGCNYNYTETCGSHLYNSQNYPGDFTFTTVPLTSIGPAPGQAQYGQNISNSSGSFIEFDPTNRDYINYFENNYGFNRSMCYVGTDDLTTEYGSLWNTSGQSSLFEMFESLYNRLPASDGYEIIGRWIDFWLFNYDQWFNTDQNPKFLLVGSPLAEQWSKIYSGFTSPFQGNPAFIYYYFSDLSLDFYGQIGTKRFGTALATYCDLKINGSNQYPISTGTQNIVKDILGTNIGNITNADGTKLDYQTPTQGYNGGTSGFWDTYSYTGSVDVTDTFSQFYSSITDLLSGISVSGNGVIPNYILFFMVFIILVRVLKK